MRANFVTWQQADIGSLLLSDISSTLSKTIRIVLLSVNHLALPVVIIVDILVMAV